MPELPDIELYLGALRERIVGRTLQRLRIVSPFVLRTFEPPVEAVEGAIVTDLHRVGKRIAFEFARSGAGGAGDAGAAGGGGSEDAEPLFVVAHLMIAGRFRWSDKVGVKSPGKVGLATFDFDHGTLLLVEPSPKKRASIHIIRGMPALLSMSAGGVNVLEIPSNDSAPRLRPENHTVKRSLTDPRLFDGIGNAYSDEILHAARLSPIKLTSRLTDEEIARLYDAAR